MKTHLVSALLLIAGNAVYGQSTNQPSIEPSTNYVAHGEKLYLVGKNLNPGERVFIWAGWMVRSPNIVGHADTNGNLREDITMPNRWNCAQIYDYSGDTLQKRFWVPYEDGNQGPPEIGTASIATQTMADGTRQATVSAWTKPNFDYWVESATNLAGPWTLVGDYNVYYFETTNITRTVEISGQQMFFRIVSDCDERN